MGPKSYDYTLEAASNFLGPISAGVDLTVGSALRNRKPSENSRMIENLPGSRVTAEMQIFPHESLKSVIFEEEFQRDGLPLLQLEDTFPSKSDFDSNIINLFISDSEEPKNEKFEERVLKSGSLLKIDTSSMNKAEVNVQRKMKMKFLNGNQAVTSYHMKHGESFTKHLEKEKMKQHRRRVLTAVSTMHTDNKLSRATLELQLQNALRKVDAHSRLNQALLRKLDGLTLDEDFGRYKNVLLEQDEIIARLIEEKKTLEKTVRSQAKHLLASDTTTGPNGIIVFPNGSIKLLNQKIRKLNETLSTTRKTAEHQKSEIDNLRKENCQIMKRVKRQRNKIVDMKRKYNMAMRGSKEGSGDEEGSGSTESHSTSETMRNRTELVSRRLLKANVDKLLQTNLENEHKIAFLEKTLGRQKHEFDRYKMNVNMEKAEFMERINYLEKEIEKKDRLSRVQVVEVKRLQQTCKDLSYGNRKLQLASDFYTNMNSDWSVTCQKHVESTPIGMNGEHNRFSRPQPPTEKCGRSFSRSTHLNEGMLQVRLL